MKNQRTAYSVKRTEEKENERRNAPRAHRARGMTIIEAIVMIAVFGMILATIVSALRYAYRGQRFAFEQADATRSARTGMERIVRHLRETSYSDDGAYPIVEMATSSVTFYSDYDNDNKIERLRYFLDDTNLRLGVIESAGDPPAYATSTEAVSLVSDNVRNTPLGTSLFTYYDKEGDLMSDYTQIDDVAFVSVSIIVNLHPERAPEDFELRSSASLRNIK